MKQLRPNVADENDFVDKVRRQQRSGYQLLYMKLKEEVTCVAGIRECENLAWGRFLYVDDLVTNETCRNRGYATAMIADLVRWARENGCRQLHLDSGVQRMVAHKFYFASDLKITSFHFSVTLG